MSSSVNFLTFFFAIKWFTHMSCIY